MLRRFCTTRGARTALAGSARWMSTEEWAAAFKAATKDVASIDVNSTQYEAGAVILRKLLRTGLLKHTDLVDKPERFFLAHRLLAAYATKAGPGFWIRFTVHYNLCVGTVLGIGSDEQIQEAVDMQRQGLLGCFALTEKLAGVSSGLVVNTEATWDPQTDTFVLNTVHPDTPELTAGSTKNWISQGLVADKAVVIADLWVNGKSHGPHGFFTDLRKDGETVPGVVLGDMGRKTVGNDLDNAWIAFDGVRVPKATMLSRFAAIEGGEYKQKVQGVPVFHMIGQRLFTGRVAVAQAALEFRRSIFAQTKAFADGKTCWDPRGPKPLSSLPQLSRLFAENEKGQAELDAFVSKCEAQLCKALTTKELPSLQLVEAIAVAKVVAVERSIEIVHRLQNEVGSYALMQGTGFDQRDFLTCCKFAEGDSRILMQKMARDRVRVFKKKEAGAAESELTEEQVLCKRLSEQDDDYDALYALAYKIIDRILTTF
ncbi:Acyl-coenzyme A oxidase [Diplonema papillatum]|nr:Acyl-coenzyme A oxidase [Diplonema papillatum]